MNAHLQSPPRVRVEWLIAGARVALASGMLAATAFAPGMSGNTAMYLLGWYFAYSLALLMLVWTPNRFAPGWAVSVHVVDVAVFALWTVLPDNAANALTVYVFVVVCAMLRWHIAGALWTAAAAVGSTIVLDLYADGVGYMPGDTFPLVTQSAYLLLVAGLVACLGTHHVRFQYEIARLAAWPRRPVHDRRELAVEILGRSSEWLRSPRTVMIWEEPDEGWINVAWQTPGGVECTQAPEAEYGSLVLPALADASFQTRNAADPRARVLLLRSADFRRRRCRPVHEALRTRFDMRAVQSWPLRGELVRGRLFCLDKRRMGLDELVLGEMVASIAVTRLESYYWHRRMRGAAALEERVRLGRDVHDHVLQALAGTALQLLAARRVLESHPDAGRQRLADVQHQMERDELEMRSFVARLRPSAYALPPPTATLRDRLEQLRERVSRQWHIHVTIETETSQDLPDAVTECVYRLVQESVINAAKHADASAVRVAISCSASTVHVQVTDDGRGFRFQGTCDLAELDRIADGPVTLKERIADLGGNLTVTSSSTGADLVITLPLARLQAETL